MAIRFDAGVHKREARSCARGRPLVEQHRIVIIGGKGGKDRVIPMSARLETLLADLLLTEGINPDDHSGTAAVATSTATAP